MNSRYQQLEKVAREWMNVIWVKKNLEQFDNFHHPMLSDMSPAGRDSTRQAYEDGIRDLFRIFPNFSAFIEDLIIDEIRGKVAIRWTASAKQVLDFYGLKPSGRTIFFSGIDIIAIDSAGLITERWGEWDGLSILEQVTKSEEEIPNGGDG